MKLIIELVSDPILWLSLIHIYLSMCRRLGKDLADEMVSRPRQLKRRHDEAVEEIRQQELLDNIAQNREAWEKKAQEMAGKYPGAEDNLAAVRKIYEYTGEEYMVLVQMCIRDRIAICISRIL